jgi:hypothetical protein
MREELEEKQALAQEVKPMEAAFIQYLLGNEERIRQYNLELRKTLVELKRILSCLERIGNALHVQRFGYSNPHSDSKPKTLRQDLDKDPSEFLKRNCVDLELRIPRHENKDGIIEDIIEKLEAKHLVPTDMTDTEFMRRIRNIKMRLYDKPYKDDILPEKFPRKAAVPYRKRYTISSKTIPFTFSRTKRFDERVAANQHYRESFICSL